MKMKCDIVFQKDFDPLLCLTSKSCFWQIKYNTKLNKKLQIWDGKTILCYLWQYFLVTVHIVGSNQFGLSVSQKVHHIQMDFIMILPCYIVLFYMHFYRKHTKGMFVVSFKHCQVIPVCLVRKG